MKKKAKIGIAAAGVVALGAIIAANVVYDPTEKTKVELHTVERTDLSSVVSASGKIQPRRMVDVATEVSGKVVEVAVEEGDQVEKGDLLLRIDPKPLRAQVQQLEAACESSRANIELSQANLAQARKDLERLETLFEQELQSLESVQRARTTVQVEEARRKSAEQELLRLQASLEEARHQLTKVEIHSDIRGTVIVVHIEEGETAFVGAFNNPATVLLTVADLSEIEAVVEVDETEAVRVEIGQKVEIEIDAHPDWIYHGRVIEVGHSPVLRAGGGEREGTAFEVKIHVLDAIPQVRPGLTCSAEIQTAFRENVVAVPIQAPVMRKPGGEEDEEGKDAEAVEAVASAGGATNDAALAAPLDDATAAAGNGATTGRGDVAPKAEADEPTEPVRFAEDQDGPRRRTDQEGKLEGVFVVVDGVVSFRPVTIGITGEKEFEIVEGLAEGEVIVTGPFHALRSLEDGDPVEAIEKDEGDEESRDS